ncbi:MAG: hypothetical protein D6814_09480 [Calditrichaeota bacterium]|nr:MAG: hypothetical protein D6814_09480 [Calditrichota bacterium]
MKKLYRVVGWALPLIFAGALIFSVGCARHPNEEQIRVMEEARAAALAAEKQLEEKRQERQQLEQQVAQKKQELEKAKQMRDQVKQRVEAFEQK